MGTSIRRTTTWLAVAVLAIAAAAWFAGGVSASPGIDAGAPPSSGCDNGALLADATYTGAQNSPDCVEGNVQEGPPSCLALGFPDAMELNRSPAANASDAYVTGTLVGGGLYLDITAGGNVDVLGAVIKGGPDANLYWGDLEGLHSPLNNGGNIPAISHWTICYDVEDEPEPRKITIAKIQVGGPADTDFEFALQCDMKSFPNVTLTGTAKTTIDLPAETGQCKVTEVDADSPGGLSDWTTTPGLSITQTLSDDEITLFEFTNTYEEEPEPEMATVTVKKKFEGPDSWQFGFAFICEDFGNADVFALGGGDSASFKVPFDVENDAIANENGNGEPHGVLCGVAEQALVGDWTVNVTVTGSDKYDTAPTELAGTSAIFAVYPDDAIIVTFENIPGYTAQKPSGLPPEIFETDDR